MASFLDFSTPEFENPGQQATKQFGHNRAAAADTRRFSDVNQRTPWGQIDYSGTPGRPDYTQTVSLNPEDQLALDEFRFQRSGLQSLISDYLMPQVAQSAGMTFNYDALPQVPAFQDFSGDGGPLPQRQESMPQAGGMAQLTQLLAKLGGQPQQAGGQGIIGYNTERGYSGGPQGQPSFVERQPTPDMEAFREEMQAGRQRRLADLVGQDEAEPTLPTTISRTDLRNFYNQTDPQKLQDMDRWLRDTGMSGNEFDIGALSDAAGRGFSGMSQRSREILALLPQWLQQWQSENAQRPAQPQTPSALQRLAGEI